MKKKIAISLPDEQVRAAKLAVSEGRADSVSAYMSEALARKQREDELEKLIEELIAEHGEPTPEDMAWARRALGLA